jgi:hypothetical protein
MVSVGLVKRLIHRQLSLIRPVGLFRFGIEPGSMYQLGSLLDAGGRVGSARRNAPSYTVEHKVKSLGTHLCFEGVRAPEIISGSDLSSHCNHSDESTRPHDNKDKV